ncbi:MAG: hypothetical protein H7259_10995, partial [Cytophagales bacterium]|nr:hypothetical protein [Cytophaga sp.]
MCRILILFLFLASFGFTNSTYAQQNGADSLFKLQFVADSLDSASIQIINKRDTVAPALLRALDSLQIALYKDSVKKSFGFPFFNLQKSINSYQRTDQIPQYQQGNAI